MNTSFMENPLKVLAVLVIVFAVVFSAKADQRDTQLNVKTFGSEAKVTAAGEECSLTSSFYDGSYRSSRTEMVFGTKEMTVDTSKAGDYVFTLRCPSLMGDPQVIVKSITSVTQGLVLSAAK